MKHGWLIKGIFMKLNIPVCSCSFHEIVLNNVRNVQIHAAVRENQTFGRFLYDDPSNLPELRFIHQDFTSAQTESMKR